MNAIPPNTGHYEILAKVLSGQGTSKEKLYIESWKNSSPAASDEYEAIKNIWQTRFCHEEDIALVTQQEVSDKIWQSAFEKN